MWTEGPENGTSRQKRDKWQPCFHETLEIVDHYLFTGQVTFLMPGSVVYFVSYM